MWCEEKAQVPGSHQDVKYQDPRTEGTCTLGQNVMPKCPNFVAGAANFQGGQKAGDTRPQKLRRSGADSGSGPGVAGQRWQMQALGGGRTLNAPVELHNRTAGSLNAGAGSRGRARCTGDRGGGSDAAR